MNFLILKVKVLKVLIKTPFSHKMYRQLKPKNPYLVFNQHIFFIKKLHQRATFCNTKKDIKTSQLHIVKVYVDVDNKYVGKRDREEKGQTIFYVLLKNKEGLMEGKKRGRRV